MPTDNPKDKLGHEISVGDHVYTKFRGGKREGEVEEIVKTAEEAEKAGVKNPPKILFKDQHGHQVAHNPGTLENLDKE
ncbi:hypothetical protein GALMADRAFT_70604 [Galerina marginata CBS 339.88]|uniref:Hypervirulence associated protein TUDOR domain-containing protein n=1 Tax=Galerina marginata (strain CBS 339.88) TaxID=685588 RepID=A0A067SUL0_GALM3|nr:hypothetical protein GALMADRAFT_70604 [Galerina marginata CBS 339.88]